MTVTAQIAAKGCSGTGITEDLAQALHDQLGKKVLAIVELISETRTENRTGDEKVGLSILSIEPVDPMATDHVRDLIRAHAMNRALRSEGEQLPLEGGKERTIDDVLAAGAAHRPHPFLPVDAADDNPICDVCGALQAAPLHSTQEALDDPDDREEPDGQDDEQVDDGATTGDAEEPDGDELEPVHYNERPSAADIARLAHIHVKGECIKNRHGGHCIPVTALPDPFTTPA